MKHDIFEFNHIDNLLSEDGKKNIKEFYKYYHKKFSIGVSRKPSNISRSLMKRLIYLEFC